MKKNCVYFDFKLLHYEDLISILWSMLEGIGVYLINYYLGEFLEDVNNDQLSVQFLSGEIILENVPIRKGAMQRFGLPINAQQGIVNKIKIIRPSATRFLYDPFIIEISGQFQTIIT